jgi:glycosyltransferase involved in cell wall biosynthesis
MTRSDAVSPVVIYDPGSFLPYYVDALCRHLAKLGVRAQVIASPPLFEPVDDGGVYDVEPLFFPILRGAVRAAVRRQRLTRWALKGATYPGGLLRSWRALARRAPGVLHVQWAPVPWLDNLLVRHLKRCGWRIIYTVHDPLLPRSRGGRAQRELLELSDTIIVHTVSQAQEIAAAVRQVADRVRVIPHGALRFPIPGPEDRARERTRLGLPPDRPILLFFGQIKPYKGLAHLLAAMPNVMAKISDVLLVIAGEPLMPMRPIEQQISGFGLRQHVVLRPSFVPAREATAYFVAADLLVAPYVRAGASGVVVMAHGHALPAVVTSVGGLPHFVNPDETGFVVPPADPATLGAAIVRGLRDRPALAGMGERAWHRLGVENDWAEVAQQTFAVYRGSTMPSRATQFAAAAHER